MAQPFQSHPVEDFLTAFDAGMNSGVSPLLLPKNQLAFGTNSTVRGAYATHRPPFTLQTLVFSDPVTQAMFLGGLWQGGGYYQPDTGIQQLLAAISGHLYLLTPTGATWNVTDVSIPGDLNDATQTQVWLIQSENYMIVTDGTATLPLFFDGTSSRRSLGNLLPYLTLVSGGATVPAAPATLTVTLALAPPKQWAIGTPVNGLTIGDYKVVSWTSPDTVVLQKLNDEDGPAVGTVIDYSTAPYIYPELPAGRLGTYGLGRVALSLTDGKQFVIGDITGGPSGTVTNSNRDAVLKVNENSYLLNGGYFSVPGAWGDIRAMIIASTLDASLGQGPLQIMTPTHCFSCNMPTDRTTWSTVTNPILTVSLISNGAQSQNSTVSANGDIMFRAVDGIRSLLLGRRDFNTWGNVPQSTEMNRVLSLDTEELLIYSSAIVFDNRMLMTAGPSAVPGHGVFHPGLIALNFDPISSLRGKAPSVYDGLWEGINTLQLVVGRFSETERGFAFTYNLATSQIELYEIGTTPVDVFSTVKWPTNAEIYDNGTTPIVWTIESPVVFNSGPKAPRQFIRMVDGEIVIDNLIGTVNFSVFYKPDQYPCWQSWFSWSECAAKTTDISKPQFRPSMGLGEPDSRACDPSTNRPMREGFNFQTKLVIQGHCRILGQNFKAITLPLSTYAKQNCTPICQPTSPLTITPTSLSNGIVDAPFSIQILGHGGASPYVFTLLSGSLPPGLTLGDFGLLSGIPTVAGTSTFTVKVRDQFGTTGTQAYSITVLNACNWSPVLPLLVAPPGGTPSVNPPWNGIFNLQTTWHAPENWPEWYFINRSILGVQVAASDLADYPSNPAWTGELMAALYFIGPPDAAFTQWYLSLNLAGISGSFWDGIMASSNMADPTGIYTFSFGSSVGIATLKVSAVPGGYCVSLI